MSKIGEIRIRNVDAGAVAKIDELAEKKGLSRNQYLKAQIESLAISSTLKEYEDRYINLVENVLSVVENCTAELERIRFYLDNQNTEIE